MSPAARQQKSTCRRCNRTVFLAEIDGKSIQLDPEIINTVPIDGAPAFVMSRRHHGDLCERYVQENLRRSSKARKKGFTL